MRRGDAMSDFRRSDLQGVTPKPLARTEVVAAAAAIANTRGGRHGMAAAPDILECLSEDLRATLMEEAEAALTAAAQARAGGAASP
jgi:hypothetical protein